MVQRIDQRGIRALFGYASSLYVLARHLAEHNLERPMDSIFTWGDSLFPHYRELIERVFRCRVNDCYGLGEGLQCAAQCEQHDALHEAMHGVIIEIVDHAGQPLPDGELGHVVVTRPPWLMPLIRYEQVISLSSWRANARAVALFDEYREFRDVLPISSTTPAGDRLIVHFFTQIFEMIPEIAQFQVRQEQADAITVKYVPGHTFSEQVLATCPFGNRGQLSVSAQDRLRTSAGDTAGTIQQTALRDLNGSFLTCTCPHTDPRPTNPRSAH